MLMSDGLTCGMCGGEATPGGIPGRPDINVVCPSCEDKYLSWEEARYPPGKPT